LYLQFPLGFIRFCCENVGITRGNRSFIPLIYWMTVVSPENMPKGPMSLFGWLMGCCVSDERVQTSREKLSAAVVFASGMAASGVTLYLAGLYHII